VLFAGTTLCRVLPESGVAFRFRRRYVRYGLIPTSPRPPGPALVFSPSNVLPRTGERTNIQPSLVDGIIHLIEPRVCLNLRQQPCCPGRASASGASSRRNPITPKAAACSLLMVLKMVPGTRTTNTGTRHGQRETGRGQFLPLKSRGRRIFIESWCCRRYLIHQSRGPAPSTALTTTRASPALEPRRLRQQKRYFQGAQTGHRRGARNEAPS
jgi:hypothetical protein